MVYRSSNMVIDDVLEGRKLTLVCDSELGEMYTQVDSIVLIPKGVANSGWVTRFYGEKMKYLCYLATNFDVSV